MSSACAKAEAEEAALCEQATVLKKKHALELQKAQIQSEIEQSALDADIAAAKAKVKVLKSYEKQMSKTKSGSTHRSEPIDGMNSYLEEQGKNGKETYLGPETSIDVQYAHIQRFPRLLFRCLQHKDKPNSTTDYLISLILQLSPPIHLL